MLNKSSIMSTLLATFVAVAMIPVAQAAIIPLDEDFDDDAGAPPTTQGDDWTQTLDNGTGSAAWSIVDTGGGDNVYRASLSDSDDNFDNTIAGSSIAVTNLAGTQFTITSSFSFNDLVNSTGQDRLRLNVVLFSSDAALSGNRMEVTFFAVDEFTPTNEGTIRIADVDGSNEFSSLSSGTLSAATGADYTWTITGSYAVPGDQTSDLTINAQLTDGTTTISTSFTDDDGTILAGDYIGFKNLLNHTDDEASFSAEIDHETLNIVPEPATLALLGLGGAVMLGGRRRRA